MFAPVPKQNFNILIKYNNKGVVGEWHDVFYETLSAHQQNRFAGYEAVQLAYSNALRYYASSVSDRSTIESDNNSNLYFVILKKIIVQKLIIENGSKPENLKIIIGIKDEEKKLTHYHYYKAIR